MCRSPHSPSKETRKRSPDAVSSRMMSSGSASSFLRKSGDVAHLHDDFDVGALHGRRVREPENRCRVRLQEALEMHHEDRMNDLYGAVADGPETPAELIPTVFRRKLGNHQRCFAIANAVAQVNHGWRIGRLSREMGEDGRIRLGFVA